MTAVRFFSLRGEVGRLGFLGGFLGWWAAFVAAALALVGWHAYRGSLPPMVPVGFALVVLVQSVGLLALHTRRLRSLGAPAPLVIAAAVLALTGLDMLVLTKLTWLRMIWPMSGMTPLAGLAQLTLHLFLFLWPASARRRTDAAEVAEAFA